MRPISKTIVLLSIAASCLLGCEQRGANEPKAVSIDQGSSAHRYPAMLERENAAVADGEKRAKEKVDKFPAALDKVKDTDWALVEKIVDASDKAGKDGGYAAVQRELAGARQFYDEEREPIVKKIGGAANYAAKQKCPDVDVWGAVSTSFKDAVDERMRERLRSSNDAFLLIERHEDALGKKNVPALEELADDVAEASYVVHVDMPEAKLRLEAMLSGAGDAKSALSSFISDEKEYAADAKRKPDEKQASEARVKKAEEHLKALEATQLATEETLKTVEQRARDLEKVYDDGLSKLKDAISQKKPK